MTFLPRIKDSPKNNFTFSHLNLQAIFGRSSIAKYSK
jgi:hypothetical protein